jgi:Tfp pilus assembly protein PilZ
MTGSVDKPGKSTARVAAIGLDAATVSLLRDCFHKFEIDMNEVHDDPVHTLQREKYEACVLRLDGDAAHVLEALRSSRPNRRMVVYGVCNSAQEATRYSRFGINAIFPESYLPDAHAAAAAGDREGVLRVVENTHKLVVNELRRHVRLPMVAEVNVRCASVRFTAYSVEISSGGVSLTGAPRLNNGEMAELSLALIDSPRLHVNAEVSWFKEPDQVGMRFASDDPRRLHVRDWVERYLEESHK